MIDENTRVNEDVDFDGDKEPLSDHLVGEGEKPELSPNPALSGYVKQENVSSLPVSPKADVLYILNGVPYRWLKAAIVEPGSDKVIIPAGWVRIGPAPNLKLNKGLHATPVEENQAPKVQPKVFTEPVHFLAGIKIKGKNLEDYIDSEGGVTEAELQAALASYLLKSEGAKVWIMDGFVDGDVSEFDVTGMKIGDIICQGSYVYIVSGITFQQNALSSLRLNGLESQYPVLKRWSDGEWLTKYINEGTQLYKHFIHLTNDDDIELDLIIIDDSSQSIFERQQNVSIENIVSIPYCLDQSDGYSINVMLFNVSSVTISIYGIASSVEYYNKTITISSLTEFTDAVTAI